MKFGNDDNVNSSVEDRRGWGPAHYGAAGAGGLGIVGTVVVLIVRALGGDVTVDDGSGTPSSTEQTTSGNATTGSTPVAGESCQGARSQVDQGKFVACVETNVQAFWSKKLSDYESSKLVLYRDETSSGSTIFPSECCHLARSPLRRRRWRMRIASSS
jgi:predicted metalloprotease